MAIEGRYIPSALDISREQVELYERSGGAEGNTAHGLPVIILTTLGAKTRAVRKSPLMRVEHNGTYVAIASFGGSPRHPKWYYNVLSYPHVEVQDGPVKHELAARVATGAERAMWWERAVAVFAPYAEYQANTERQIPVVLLEKDA